MADIAKLRPIFHSEADFQHAFAWEVHQSSPDASIRLERPIQVNGHFIHLDIWIKHLDETVAVELKYKTHALSVEVGGEHYRLKSHSALDCGRHDFIRDIERLEHVAVGREGYVGYAVMLTNESGYWHKSTSHEAADAEFRIHSGRVLEGKLGWGPMTSDGTKYGRERPLTLQGKYEVEWTDFSHPGGATYGKFRSLIVKVS